eukprot:CAMPEP_0117422624 /NCGR_PEP_ID=MMETSP0758-20121206/3432_1 /TAXON_ID=63605 /ORGANISM="Percolomonas cosmopolitus, Strain AE-1 (ATCC 50343)" /LENGTH=408 /DNA_ID=CAMNT_0005205367 /DNA_START=512 /DNA_END=1738 /DNA_ORIENTATION=-
MKGHRDAITDFTFHPEESLIVTSSKDKTVKLWDFDSFKCLESTPITSTRIRHVVFDPEGRCVLAGAQDNIKVWGWEPRKNYDHIDSRWNDLDDMMIQSDYRQVLVASMYQHNVTIHGIPLNTLSPYGSSSGIAKSNLKNYMMHTASSTKNKAKRGHRSASVLANNDHDRHSYAERPHKSPTMAKQMVRDDMSAQKKKSQKSSGKAHLIGTELTQPLKLKPVDFICNEPYTYKLSDDRTINNLLSDHNDFIDVVDNRLKNYVTIREYWYKENRKKQAIEALANLDDKATSCDILRQVIKYVNQFFNLEMCGNLLPLLQSLIESKNDEQILCGMMATKELYRAFSPIINQTLAIDSNYNVDLARASRQSNSHKCRQLFLSIHSSLSRMTSSNFEINENSQYLIKKLEHFI